MTREEKRSKPSLYQLGISSIDKVDVVYLKFVTSETYCYFFTVILFFVQGRCTTVEVAHSFLRVISVLSLTDRKNNSSSFLPDNLREMLPQCVCNFLISVALVSSTKNSSCLITPICQFMFGGEIGIKYY